MTTFRECVEEQLKAKRVPRRKVKAALDRFDQLRDNFIDEGVPLREVDPRAFARAKRRQERLVRQNGSDFFFEPGDTAPDRLPELF